MSKTDKLIVALLGLLLVGYVWHSFNQSKKEAEAQAKYQQELAAWEAAHPEEAAREKAAAQPSATAPAAAQPTTDRRGRRRSSCSPRGAPR